MRGRGGADGAASSAQHTPMAWLSRAEVVQLGNMLVFALPAARRAAQCLDILAPVLGHALAMVDGGWATDDCLQRGPAPAGRGYAAAGRTPAAARPRAARWPVTSTARSHSPRSTIRRWTASRQRQRRDVRGRPRVRGSGLAGTAMPAPKAARVPEIDRCAHAGRAGCRWYRSRT